MKRQLRVLPPRLDRYDRPWSVWTFLRDPLVILGLIGLTGYTGTLMAFVTVWQTRTPSVWLTVIGDLFPLVFGIIVAALYWRVKVYWAITRHIRRGYPGSHEISDDLEG